MAGLTTLSIKIIINNNNNTAFYLKVLYVTFLLKLMLFIACV